MLPTMFGIVANLWTALRDAAPWIDVNTAQQPLFMGMNLSAEQWWQFASATGISVVLPFVLGLIHVLRAEVK